MALSVTMITLLRDSSLRSRINLFLVLFTSVSDKLLIALSAVHIEIISEINLTKFHIIFPKMCKITESFCRNTRYSGLLKYRRFCNRRKKVKY